MIFSPKSTLLSRLCKSGKQQLLIINAGQSDYSDFSFNPIPDITASVLSVIDKLIFFVVPAIKLADFFADLF